MATDHARVMELMYSDVEQQQQAQSLGKRLQQAENDVNAAVEKARSAQVAAEEKMKQLHKDASDFLAK